MPKPIDIDWSCLSQEDRKVLSKLGFKPPKKVRKVSTVKYTNLKDKGVPIQIQRNIFCYCCGSTTVEFVTSYVPKELQNKDREAITDSVRTCKKCFEVLKHLSVDELVDKVMKAYRTFTYE
jgi:hypothetical protein